MSTTKNTPVTMKFLEAKFEDRDGERSPLDRIATIQTSWDVGIAVDIVFPPCVSLADARERGKFFAASPAMAEALKALLEHSDACFDDIKQIGNISKVTATAYRKARLDSQSTLRQAGIEVQS